MRGTPVRVARLAVAAGIAGVLTAGAAPALAANNISYYSGAASGSAVTASINPSAVMDVRLSALQNLLNSLNDLPGVGSTGIGSTINNTIGSTLSNPTAPITVTVDAARATGTSAAGTVLTDGNATSTAVAIDAASLNTEVDLLNKAIQDMPSGTVDALRNALAPLIAADKTGKLGPAFNTILPGLAKPITGALGSPTVNILQSVNARWGETARGNLTTVNKGGLLTPNSKLELQPFEAHALPSDAFASNAVDTLALVPSGALGVPSQQQLLDSLKVVEATLLAVENAVTDTSGSLGTGSVTGLVTGAVFPVVNGAVGNVDSSVSSTLKTTDITKVNDLIKSLNSIIDLLSGLNGLQLNDIIGNNGDNALSTLGRSQDAVVANGIGQVAHVDVLKLKGGMLADLLTNNVPSAVTSNVPGGPLAFPTSLVSVDGIKATANVSLDGANAPKQSANGTLLDVKVLGRSLSSLTPGQLALDNILGAGTSCTINIPGKSTCRGIDLNFTPAMVSSQLDDIQTKTGQAIPTLLTVNLTRGAGVVDPTNNVKYGRADITVLQVTSNVNCGAVSQLTNALGAASSTLTGAEKQLAGELNLHLAACGLGITDGAANPAAAHTATAKAKPNATSAGVAPLVNVSLGVAHAEVNLTSAVSTTTNIPGTLPPTTGNDLLILAGVALAAVAGGIALQVRKARA